VSGSHELSFGEIAIREETNYPMTVAVHHGRNLGLSYSYIQGELGDEVVCTIARHTIRLLRQLPEMGTRLVGEIELVLDEERARLERWGVNAERYADVQPVHRLTEAQVAVRPQATALVFGDEVLSYAELNGQANRLAHRLIALGAGPEVRVGVALERSVELVVSLLAILKSGAAYVPLDPDYPAERVAYMVADSGIGLLVTHSELAGRVPTAEGVRVVEVDRLDLAGEPEGNPDVRVLGENLAYVIYTSGSTGRPKGVEVAHGPLSAHLQAIGDLYGFGPEDRVLQFASFSFDAAMEQWLLPMMRGSEVVLRSADQLAFEELADLIRYRSVTTINLPPAYLSRLLPLLDTDIHKVSRCIAGGEAFLPEHLQLAQAICGSERLFNSYGPTETVITPATWHGAVMPAGASYVPIGRPVGMRQAYVLDSSMHLAPQGVVGELYMGGVCLARGYLNRPGATAERFVADPFDEAGGRLYRTGDLVKWNAAGELEYLGRIDHQVKIRGFRIELGEIEAKLLAQPEVREAVVVAGEGPGGSRLVGYVSLHEPIEMAELRERLGRELPEYMVPSVVMVLESLPLNANGKVDRKALPVPEVSAEGEYEAPVGEIEEALAAIWAEVLKVPLEQVGRRSNFFELGGDSILSLQVISRAKATGHPELVGLQLRQLMLRPMIGSLLGEVNVSDSSLVSLNRGNTDTAPLFCIHPGLGGIYDYRPLAQKLEGIRKTYGIACPMLGELSRNYGSLEEMADDYVEWIVRKQPQGAYHLLGWSLGGALAAMIASRLEKMGGKVGFLGLIDSFIPGARSDSAGSGHETDWKKDFTGQFQLIVPGFDVAEQLPNLEDAENVDAISGLIDDFIEKAEKSGWARKETYAALGTEDMARMFIVGRRLSRLSGRANCLLTLRVEPHYWWSRGTTAGAKERLGEQLGSDMAAKGTVVQADHTDMVHNPKMLNEIVANLAHLGGGMS